MHTSKLGRFTDLISKYWERVLFGLLGLACFGAAARMIFLERISEGAALFGIGFFCFLYSNVSRFKRFKGLGFEAELWEDKQKEAAGLIDRLKSVVEIYSREIVMSRVMMGRWGDDSTWHHTWQLFDDLITQHNNLGQSIDFFDLKVRLDQIFIFDAVSTVTGRIMQRSRAVAEIASREGKSKFGSPVTDIDGYNKHCDLVRLISIEPRNQFELSKTQNIANQMLEMTLHSEQIAKEHFNIESEYDVKDIDDLKFLDALYDKIPVNFTTALIDRVHEIIKTRG